MGILICQPVKRVVNNVANFPGLLSGMITAFFSCGEDVPPVRLRMYFVLRQFTRHFHLPVFGNRRSIQLSYGGLLALSQLI